MPFRAFLVRWLRHCQDGWRDYGTGRSGFTRFTHQDMATTKPTSLGNISGHFGRFSDASFAWGGRLLHHFGRNPVVEIVLECSHLAKTIYLEIVDHLIWTPVFEANSTVGTPSYLSPEICKNNPYGVKAGIHLFGGVETFEFCHSPDFPFPNKGRASGKSNRAKDMGDCRVMFSQWISCVAGKPRRNLHSNWWSMCFCQADVWSLGVVLYEMSCFEGVADWCAGKPTEPSLGWISKANRKTGVTKKFISDQKKWDTNPQPCSPDTTYLSIPSIDRLGRCLSKRAIFQPWPCRFARWTSSHCPKDFSWTTQRVGQGLSNE